MYTWLKKATTLESNINERLRKVLNIFTVKSRFRLRNMKIATKTVVIYNCTAISHNIFSHVEVAWTPAIL